MRNLANLRSLRRIEFYNCTEMSDAIKQISMLPELREFGPYKDITLEDLSALQRAARLETLYLGHSGLDDASIGTLSGFPRLKRLDLANTELTDQSAAALAKLPDLESLTITEVEFTPQGLMKLAALSRLRTLIANHTSLNDEVLRAWMSKLLSLRVLDISDTDVSAAGLKSLSSAKELSWLKIPSGSLDDDSIAELNLLPNLGSLLVHGGFSTCEQARAAVEVPRFVCDRDQ